MNDIVESRARLKGHCPGCDRPIYRNDAGWNKERYHWYCLKMSGLLPQASHLCLDCWSYLGAQGIVRTEMPDGCHMLSCPNCGGTRLQYQSTRDLRMNDQNRMMREGAEVLF